MPRSRPSSGSGSDGEWSAGILTGFFLMFLVTVALCVAIYQLEGEDEDDWEPELRKPKARAIQLGDEKGKTE